MSVVLVGCGCNGDDVGGGNDVSDVERLDSVAFGLMGESRLPSLFNNTESPVGDDAAAAAEEDLGMFCVPAAPYAAESFIVNPISASFTSNVPTSLTKHASIFCSICHTSGDEQPSFGIQYRLIHLTISVINGISSPSSTP